VSGAPPDARLARVAARLGDLSRRHRVDADARFAWPTRPDPDRLAWPTALSALAGLPAAASLTDEQRWRLALKECTHFFSLNVAGERVLIAGLEARLGGSSLGDASAYLAHFLAEERAHTAVFRRFCDAYGGGVYPDRQLRFPREHLPGEEEFLFYGQALLFEEVAHHLNVACAEDPDGWSVARTIHAYHAEEETRHVAFGRLAVEALWARSAPAWGDEGRARVGDYLGRYLDAIARNTVSPAVFRDAGVPGDPYALRDAALASPARAALVEAVTRRARRVLVDLGAVPG